MARRSSSFLCSVNGFHGTGCMTKDPERTILEDVDHWHEAFVPRAVSKATVRKQVVQKFFGELQVQRWLLCMVEDEGGHASNLTLGSGQVVRPQKLGCGR